MQTTHQIHFEAAQQMAQLANESVDLVITSPPYPMIEMWDGIMSRQNPAIQQALDENDGAQAFELMHQELDKVWLEVNRVAKLGSFVCINIGDATRSMDGEFQLFSNHSRIIHFFVKQGFTCLPSIIWRKPTNSPNKFMGSGMLPAGAYMTLEHEHILIFRKGGKRIFKSNTEKQTRQNSAFFWEERNQWFSDLWDVRGTSQKLNDKNTRERSGAYPFEIPFRLINMYSVKGDLVLDPFVGTGTTSLAAMATGRRSVGYEIDGGLSLSIEENLSENKLNLINDLIRERLQKHMDFVEKRRMNGDTELKHFNHHYDFPVMTNQETELIFSFLKSIEFVDNQFIVDYSTQPLLRFEYIENHNQKTGQQMFAF